MKFFWNMTWGNYNIKFQIKFNGQDSRNIVIQFSPSFQLHLEFQLNEWSAELSIVKQQQ